MKDKPKYTHFFALNFTITSALEGANDEEADKLYKEARLHLKQRLDLDKHHIEWYDTEENES